ncbi:hypothetical protein [Aquimarina sp. 2201CG5-10]|uniref:hypothetical protein n=1 Tax=Aquimarina callyspongiae TaxID=3098150 RepID=UPI002AB38288|nr:hypothetical protein [Aquimarina sp. 2201CG5-10]MDY8135446.1 hypothetical protein [Aquimarina sp. 2201CG5-10]
MKKKLLIFISIIIVLYIIGGNFPRGTFKIEDKNVKIKMSITDNFWVFRDPECTKRIEILDGNEKLNIKFWSEVYEVKIFKRVNGEETFWVIDEYYRGATRSINGEFTRFTCAEPECWTVNTIEGKNILSFEFKNGEWTKINL